MKLLRKDAVCSVSVHFCVVLFFVYLYRALQHIPKVQFIWAQRIHTFLAAQLKCQKTLQVVWQSSSPTKCMASSKVLAEGFKQRAKEASSCRAKVFSGLREKVPIKLKSCWSKLNGFHILGHLSSSTDGDLGWWTMLFTLLGGLWVRVWGPECCHPLGRRMAECPRIWGDPTENVIWVTLNIVPCALNVTSCQQYCQISNLQSPSPPPWPAPFCLCPTVKTFSWFEIVIANQRPLWIHRNCSLLQLSISPTNCLLVQPPTGVRLWVTVTEHQNNRQFVWLMGTRLVEGGSLTPG